MLLLASTGLEFTRLYRFESQLPGHHAGGVLGYLVGSTANSWLGFNGSGLIFIVFMVIGLSWVFRFSWIQLAEKMGAAIDGLIQQQREKREIAQDLALGEAAARAREKDMSGSVMRTQTYQLTLCVSWSNPNLRLPKVSVSPVSGKNLCSMICPINACHR